MGVLAARQRSGVDIGSRISDELAGPLERFDLYPDVLCKGKQLGVHFEFDTLEEAKWQCISQPHCSGFSAHSDSPNRYVLFVNLTQAAPKRGHSCYLSHSCTDFGCEWLHDNRDDHKLHRDKHEHVLRRNDEIHRRVPLQPNDEL